MLNQESFSLIYSRNPMSGMGLRTMKIAFLSLKLSGTRLETYDQIIMYVTDVVIVTRAHGSGLL